MSEQGMRGRINKILKLQDAVSVENPAYPGTPDINYVEGWLELKWMKRWPKNCDKSPVLIEHFTPQQRAWLLRRWKRGGNAFLLLQVGREYLLFNGRIASEIVGRADRDTLRQNVVGHWMNGLNTEEFKRCLDRN